MRGMVGTWRDAVRLLSPELDRAMGWIPEECGGAGGKEVESRIGQAIFVIS